jgi:hypothetical protein
MYERMTAWGRLKTTENRLLRVDSETVDRSCRALPFLETAIPVAEGGAVGRPREGTGGERGRGGY